MCGLIGEFNNDATFTVKKRAGFISQSLICDVVRGYDSTGVFAVHRHFPQTIFKYKKAVAGYDFVQLKKYLNFENSMNAYRFVVGHNRWATKGGVSDETAHPFTKGHITLVHNGTLHQWANLNTKDKYKVDSEAIAASMEENGATETIKKLDGAYALIWYDAIKEKMFMVRNKERPLYYATLKDSDAIIFASEYGMLSWLGHRNGYNIKEIHEVEIDKLYEFDKDFDKGGILKTSVETYTPPFYQKQEVKDWLKPYNGYKEQGLTKHNLTMGEWIDAEVIKYTPYTSKGHLGVFTCKPLDTTDVLYKVHGKEHDELTMGNVITSEIISFIYKADAPDEKKDQVLLIDPMDTTMTKKEYLVWDAEQQDKYDKETAKIAEADWDGDEDIPEYVQGPGNKVVTIEEYVRLTKNGCAQCSADIFLTDDEDLQWTVNDDPICLDCCTANEIVNIGITTH